VTPKIQALRSARHLNLEVFRDDEDRPPSEAEPLPRVGVGANRDLSPLDIVSRCFRLLSAGLEGFDRLTTCQRFRLLA
jgi:hypothetical protein